MRGDDSSKIGGFTCPDEGIRDSHGPEKKRRKKAGRERAKKA